MANKNILLSHGSGGKMSHDLISSLFLKYFDNDILNAQTDSAILNIRGHLLSFTTDSYVVDPIFFPGGNIGKLAVCGTVNDLAVSGAVPEYISAGFILEEGFDMEQLETIVQTMAEEAQKAGVKIVTGDTKVVNKGKCDKIFINTAGIGILHENHKHISTAKNIEVGDKIIVNGNIGDHGIAILAARESLNFQTEVVSDCYALNNIIQKVLTQTDQVKFMRDATRGGLATVLTELAVSKNMGIRIDESTVPINETVKGACEMFGFDPFFLANEGKVVMVSNPEAAEKIVEILKSDSHCSNATIIGEITENPTSKVILETEIGGNRILDIPAGEQLPRIC